MNRLREKYVKEVVPSLTKKYNYKTPMLVPKLEKIVVNMGVGDAQEHLGTTGMSMKIEELFSILNDRLKQA